MLEPAAYGANVAFGPNTSNFRDIANLLLDSHAAQRLPSLDAILPWLRHELANRKAGQQRGRIAQDLIAAQRGTLDRTARALVQLIDIAASPQQHDRRVA